MNKVNKPQLKKNNDIINDGSKFERIIQTEFSNNAHRNNVYLTYAQYEDKYFDIVF